MSYDLELFQLAPGVEMEEINAFIDSDAFEEYQEWLEEQEEEGDDEELPSLPERFINTSLAEEELKAIIGRAYFRATIPESERTPEMQAFLASSGPEECPDDHAEDFDIFFEYQGSPGVQPLMFSFGSHLKENLEMVSTMLEELQSQRIVAYDPQLGRVIGGFEARTLLLEGVEEED